MLTERSGNAGDVPAYALLSSDEASQFGALTKSLPEGWVVELRPDPDIVWVAFVYQADAPRSSPLLTVCRRDDRVGLYVQSIGEAHQQRWCLQSSGRPRNSFRKAYLRFRR